MTSRFLFVTDLDNTLVGDDDALNQLNQQLSQHRQNYGTKIVYSTGRSLTLYRQLEAEKHLLVPDALVTSVGTEIYYHGSETPDAVWTENLAQEWDREVIVDAASQFPELVPQQESEQRPFKVSYFLPGEVSVKVLPQLETLCALLHTQRGLSIKLIYSGNRDLDFLPKHGGKGAAMQFLRRQWEFAPDHTVACGDSGNDIALFAVGEGYGIIVGNALPELRQWYEANSSSQRYLAKSYYAAGILEGLNHFSFL